FSAPLASGSTNCTRSIQADGDLSIVFVDGVEGCGGPGAPADAMTPAEDLLPPEGEVPAEGDAPAEPPAG
ncbi:MAG: hypothetical protein ACRES3_00375, partial [Steroidobacteraceae bacterium]